MFITTSIDGVARITTADDIREIVVLLSSILRKNGAVDAKDGDSMDTLDSVHFLGLVCLESKLDDKTNEPFNILSKCISCKADDSRKNVNRDYVNKLMERHNVFAKLHEKYLTFSLSPYMVLEKFDTPNLHWNDVELLLSMFHPHMAKQAIMQKYGF